MSERAQAVDGEVQVETRLGHGTDVVCRLPYHCRRVDPLEAMENGPGEEASL